MMTRRRQEGLGIMMKGKKHQRQQGARPVEGRESTDRETDQQAEYDAVIEADPLLEEVGEANERIGDPGEAVRVVLSKPCEDDASDHEEGRSHMTTARQRGAAKRNVKKAAMAAKRKQTLKHLPKEIKSALGKQGAKTRSRRRAA